MLWAFSASDSPIGTTVTALSLFETLGLRIGIPSTRSPGGHGIGFVILSFAMLGSWSWALSAAGFTGGTTSVLLSRFKRPDLRVRILLTAFSGGRDAASPKPLFEMPELVS